MKRKALLFLVVGAIAFFTSSLLLDYLRAANQSNNTITEAENFDIRDTSAKDASIKYKNRLEKIPQKQIEQNLELRESIQSARERPQLLSTAPVLDVKYSSLTNSPEIIEVKGGGSTSLQAAVTSQSRGTQAKEFLSNNAELFGMTPAQVEKFTERNSYTNPNGKLSWVNLEQRWNGMKVFRGDLTAVFDSDGDLIRTVGEITAGPKESELTITPKVSAAQAVVNAASAANLNINENDLTIKEISTDGRTIIFNPAGPFTDDIKLELQYFPLDAGLATLAWSMVLWQDSPSYYTLVDAEEGLVLWRKNITNDQSESATYLVYNGDSPAPLSPTNALPGSGIQGVAIPRTSFTLLSEGIFNNLGWLTDGVNTTTGNNVDSGMDLVSPNGIDPTGRPVPSIYRVFDFSYNPGPGIPPPGDVPTLADYRFGEAVNMFFWVNRYHDRVYELGFTESARNFQNDNFGRGGIGNDRVMAEGQDSSGTNNANFATPPDGSSGRMQMYIFTGPTPRRTSGLDQEIVIHELTHGLSNRLHNNASGLTNTMSRGMGEGWSDFYALSLLSTSGEDPHAVYAVGGYSTLGIVAGFTDNYYYGIRRFPHSTKTTVGTNGKPHNPLTFADIDPLQINLTDGAYGPGPIGSATAFQVHNIGEVWCAGLWEVRAKLIDKYGWANGNQRMLQIVTDGMKLDPVNPTLLDGRNSILTANLAGYAGADELDIWAGFATRGMGYSASAVSSASSSVVEAFDMPNINLDAVTFTEDAACETADGYADPGESLTLSIPLSNPYKATSATGVTISVNGGAAISYGAIPANSSVSKSLPFIVPNDAALCGALLPINITITSSLGTVTRTYNLRVGRPVITLTASYSSSSVPVDIPDLSSVDIPIDVTHSGSISDVNVKLRLNHTYDSDLVMTLIGPDGTTVALSTNRGGAGQNFGSGTNDCSGTPTIFDDSASTLIGSGIAPFAGSYKPDSPLSAFNGKPMFGQWILRISDIGPADIGTVGCVTLEISRERFACCGVPGIPEIYTAPPATLDYESSPPGNGAPDPDETVTMSFPLWNVGTSNTTNLTATLLEGGGVLAPSSPQNYGALVAGGATVSKPFTFTVTGTCGGNLTATFALKDGALDLGTVTFTIRIGGTISATSSFVNTTAIAIPGSGTGAGTGAPANPYPSTIEVSGITGSVSKVTVEIANFNHTWPNDVDILLVGPQGQKLLLMSDVGGGTDAVNANLTFDDSAAAMGATIISGTFKPTNISTGDLFPAPAPAGPYPDPQKLSVFNGISPNGTWSLYAVDDVATDIGNISGGWKLNITTTDPLCSVTACALTTPADIVVNNDLFMPGAIVNYPAPIFTGSCGVVKPAPLSGSFFPIGVTPVVITGTRQDGSTTTTSFKITVKGPTSGFASGGGTIYRNGEHANFGFNVKYHWDGKLYGELTYIERCSNGMEKLKSTKMEFLQVYDHKAVFIGKATIDGVPGYTFRATVEDYNCRYDRGDKFGLQVTAPNGAPVPELTFAPVKLRGGSIQVWLKPGHVHVE